MKKLQPLKSLSHKVAVVVGSGSPVGALVCLKLVQQGAKLLLIEERTDTAEVALGVNLIWGGMDVNEYGARYRDPWGAKPVAGHLTERCTCADAEGIVACCLEFFGRKPDFIVDLERKLNGWDLAGIVGSSQELPLVCIQPFSDRSLWSPGWLGASDGENLDPEMTQSVSVYLSCPKGVISALSPDSEFQEMCADAFCSQSNVLMCKTDDLVQMLAYVLYAGRYVRRTEFQVLLDEASENSDKCSVFISPVSLTCLSDKANRIEEASTEGRRERETEIQLEQDDLDEYLSSESDLLNNGTFDAVLQKAKDYPVDWWQGGSECSVAVDDISYKIMTRAAVNFAFRWLVLGYFVIGFAVPKALGWDGP